MIWLRRFLAVLLTVLLLPIFLVTLIVFRVNDTVLAADFYVDQLRKADIFTFLYDEVIPAAFDEVSEESQELPIDPELVEEHLVASLREVLPPQWLQGQVELVIVEAVPYLTGDADSFAITISVTDRLEALGDEVKRELGGGDTYDLLFDEVIAPALEEQLQDVGDLPLGITIASQDIVEAVQEVIPPQWIQARVEHVVDQVVPYTTGRAQHFAIYMPVADRLEALAPVLKDLLVRSKVYDVLSSQEFADAVDERLLEFGELPFGLNLTSEQIVPAVQTVAPPQWLQAQVEHILDEMVLYVTGKQDGFEVVVPLKDRVQVAVPVVKQLLRDVNAYDLLFDQVVTTMVEENLGQLAELPLGVTLTADEITPLLREVLPPEFVQEQTENMLDEVTPYLTGEAAGFRVVVPLAERKEAALEAIEDLAERKLNELAASLPRCTVAEALDLAREGFTGMLPPCIPAGASLEEIKQELGIQIPGITLEQIEEQLGIDLTIVAEGVTLERIEQSFGIDLVGEVGRFIGDALPDEFTYTDADLRDTLSEEDEEILDQALDWTRNGFKYTDADLRKDLAGEGGDTSRVEFLDQVLEWGRQGLTYTDANLREDLSAEDEETLDQVLEWTRNGFTFTDADLRELALEEEGAREIFKQFEQMRGWLGLARSLLFLLFLLPGAFLAMIGFLGGRQWSSRVAWAAVALGIVAGIAYVAFGPVYRGVAEPFVDDRLAEVTRDATGVQLLAAQKAVDVARTVVGDFVGGLKSRALLLFIASIVVLGLTILWPTLYRLARVRPREEPVPEVGPEEPGPEEFERAEAEEEVSEQVEPERKDPGQDEEPDRGSVV